MSEEEPGYQSEGGTSQASEVTTDTSLDLILLSESQCRTVHSVPVGTASVRVLCTRDAETCRYHRSKPDKEVRPPGAYERLKVPSKNREYGLADGHFMTPGDFEAAKQASAGEEGLNEPQDSQPQASETTPPSEGHSCVKYVQFDGFFNVNYCIHQMCNWCASNG